METATRTNILTGEECPHSRQHTECHRMLLPVRDTLDILMGRWKIPIIISLTFGSKRFGEIAKDLDGITDRMLSKELKELEINQLIERNVYSTFPPKVEYSITDHGRTLHLVIKELHDWGSFHRKKVLGNN